MNRARSCAVRSSTTSTLARRRSITAFASSGDAHMVMSASAYFSACANSSQRSASSQMSRMCTPRSAAAREDRLAMHEGGARALPIAALARWSDLRTTKPCLESRGEPRQRKTQREINCRRRAIDLERAQRALDRLLCGARQLEHADDGGERRVLDEDRAQADEGRQHPASRLRQDHEAHRAGPAQAPRTRRFALTARD